jgi:hypothetical protein
MCIDTFLCYINYWHKEGLRRLSYCLMKFTFETEKRYFGWFYWDSRYTGIVPGTYGYLSKGYFHNFKGYCALYYQHTDNDSIILSFQGWNTIFFEY